MVTGNIVYKFKTSRALTTTKRALDRAYKDLAPKIEKEIKSLINIKTGPRGPGSPPGTPPYKRTGALHGSVTVTGSEKRGFIVRTVHYGGVLEHSPRKKMKRPFIAPVIGPRSGRRAEWQQKLANLALKHQGGRKRRRSSRRA